MSVNRGCRRRQARDSRQGSRGDGASPMRIGAAALAASLWLALAGPMALAQTPDRGRGGEDQVTLNFKDADVEAVVAAFGHLLDRIFVIDPRVRGKMTLE